MAAIALKGMDKATTNFPKERYVHEPFMQVRHACPCAKPKSLHVLSATLSAPPEQFTYTRDAHHAFERHMLCDIDILCAGKQAPRLGVVRAQPP